MRSYDQVKSLSNFRVIVDTREKNTEKSKIRFREFGSFERQALTVGDYTFNATLPSGKKLHDETHAVEPMVAIESKLDLGEIASCFAGNKKHRFYNELERAKAAGCKLYLLVEDATWDDIFEHRYRSQMQPEVLIANLNAIQARYDVHLVFCKSEYSGKLIKCLLYREFKELLQQGKFDDMTL